MPPIHAAHHATHGHWRYHQVTDWVDLVDRIILGTVLGGDLQHFVANDVGQFERIEHQPQRTAQGNRRKVQRDWSIGIDPQQI